MSESDLLKTALTCGIFVITTLLWVFCSKQQSFPRTFRRAISIILRIAVVHVIVVGFFYGLDGIAIDTLLKWLPVVVVLLVLARPNNVEFLSHLPGDGELFAAIVLTTVVTVFVPIYALKQFVLGFPDKGHFLRLRQKMQETPEPQLPTPSLPEFPLSGTAGVVSAQLRPMGTVSVNGTGFPARHIANDLVDVDVAVQVCDVRNGILLVRETAEEQLAADG